MLKTYSVNFLGVARFMSSNAGEEFLRDQTTSYFPYWGMRRTAVQALPFSHYRRCRRWPDLFGNDSGWVANGYAASGYLQYLFWISECLCSGPLQSRQWSVHIPSFLVCFSAAMHSAESGIRRHTVFRHDDSNSSSAARRRACSLVTLPLYC
jgi:hypothetical protein